MANNPKLNEYIDAQLRNKRPDRYQLGDSWIEEVVDSIPLDMVPVDEMRRIYLREQVNRREGEATKSANRILRKWNQTGQLELHWWNSANEPLAIEYVDVDDEGEPYTKNERVALRAATPQDLRLWANSEYKAAKADFEARKSAVDGARDIAALIENGGFHNFKEWAEFQSGEDSAA